MLTILWSPEKSWSSGVHYIHQSPARPSAPGAGAELSETARNNSFCKVEPTDPASGMGSAPNARHSRKLAGDATRLSHQKAAPRGMQSRINCTQRTMFLWNKSALETRQSSINATLEGTAVWEIG
ncbi:hypothetical protein Bbelb_011050 [Branchiostoma belcheri]|nr:hypothetical protein Bbelb_011050 [Branchiostoma belcheri]